MTKEAQELYRKACEAVEALRVQLNNEKPVTPEEMEAIGEGIRDAINSGEYALAVDPMDIYEEREADEGNAIIYDEEPDA